MSPSRLFLVLVTLVPALARAQDLVVYAPAVPFMAEETAAGPAYPGVSMFRFPIAYPLLPPMPFPAGDATMNNATGVITYTNGMMIGQVNDPAYPALAPAMPPIALPPIMPFPITGIAVDSAAGTLWITNGVMIASVFLMPGFPIAVPPMPLAPILGPVPPITGLDWDPTTGTLWAVTGAGAVFSFLPPPAIGLAFGPILPPVAVPGIATDIVIARDGVPGMVAGIYVQTTLATANYTTGILSPLPAGMPPGTPCGIAFHNWPDQLVGGCGCGAAAAPVLGFTGPSTIGNAGFALTVSGVPAGSIVYVAVDGVFVPGGAAWPLGCTLYLSPASASLTLTPILAGPGGVAVMPAPLPPLPGFIGAFGFVQIGVPCAANPSGFVLSNMGQVIVGAM